MYLPRMEARIRKSPEVPTSETDYEESLIVKAQTSSYMQTSVRFKELGSVPYLM
jgi:hypothetical protein